VINEGEDSKAKVYEELKLNAAKGSDCNRSPIDLNFDSYTRATTASEFENNLQVIMDEMLYNRCKKTEYYAILGIELANLKFLIIRSKCPSCCEATDMYIVLDCPTCNSRKNPSKQYYSTARNITKFSRDYINFLIAIGRLCRDYPKFLHATMSTDDLKNKLGLRYLLMRMTQDVEFWK
jgi:hypothetical protein